MAGKRDTKIDVPQEVALEKLTEYGLDPWLDSLRREAGEEAFLEFAWLCKEHETGMRAIIGGVATGVEIGAGYIPMPEKLRNAGEEILKHLPVAIQRWAMKRFPAELPDSFQPPTLDKVPGVLWRFFRGAINEESLKYLYRLQTLVRRYLGEHVVARFRQTMERGSAGSAEQYRQDRKDILNELHAKKPWYRTVRSWF